LYQGFASKILSSLWGWLIEFVGNSLTNCRNVLQHCLPTQQSRWFLIISPLFEFLTAESSGHDPIDGIIGSAEAYSIWDDIMQARLVARVWYFTAWYPANNISPQCVFLPKWFHTGRAAGDKPLKPISL